MKCPQRSKWSAALLLFPCLLIISTKSAVVAQEDVPAKDTLNLFAAYPKSQALDYIAFSHASHKGLDKYRRILYATWFLGGDPRVAMQSMVDDKGQVYTVRSVFDWADQGGGIRQLTDQQLKSLSTTLEDLPSSAQSPPLAFIVVLTVRHRDSWLTRIYDRRKLPAKVKRIYEITGATLETNR